MVQQHNPIEERLCQLMAHLGLERAHFAARLPDDWGGLATHYPQRIASLSLLYPMEIAPHQLAPLGERLLIFTGDQPIDGERVAAALPTLPDAQAVVATGYKTALWTDVANDRAEEITTTLTQFLSDSGRASAVSQATLRTERGEVAGIFYQISGQGVPLILLPLGLAPSGWEPLVAQLSQHFCTIVLGGPQLGLMPFLEQRGQSAGYLRMVRNLFEEIDLQPGERVLDVGCGSGVIDRWLARRMQGQNPIHGVDINPFLLKEAQVLAKAEQVDHLITFQQGNAEALPFPDQHFDVVFSTTVMEEVDADQMLRELVRVTKPGGRIGVIVRARDLAYTVNVPVRQELKAPLEMRPWQPEDERQSCASATLYRRFHNSTLAHIRTWPHLVAFDNPYGAVESLLHSFLFAAFTPAETAEYLAGVDRAAADGTYFITWPHHCAVGVKQ
ncbi:MAG: methyltransferase domain-containing protein [Caldilinea sp. CFX5]|nr:methyltransferase domain-containing protein [Caldilinea sp. CFX5]